MACPFGAPQYDASRGVVGKCHLCAHRVDAGRLPACVAACPTEALRVLDEAGEEEARSYVPGFSDVDDCEPATRFKVPGGAWRQRLFVALEERLRKRVEK
jgi:Fe-S-cluster-containing dehydrogenase component